MTPVLKPDFQKAAERLAANRLKPIALTLLEDEIRPVTVEDAYVTQPMLHALLKEAGLGKRAGYKIGCTTPVMQDFLDIRHPCAGGVMEKTIHHHRADLGLEDYARVGIECEIAMRLSSDIVAGDMPHTRDSVRDAIECCMVAAEIVDDRYADFHTMGTPTLVADDFFGAGCVLGDPVTAWRDLDLSTLRGRTLLNGEEVGHGTGEAVLGHPLEAVAWLANLKGEAGETLKAGEFILTGSLVETKWPDMPGDEIIIDVSELGRLEIRFF